MKRTAIIITALIVLITAASCNLDSASGLFEDAGKSVKKESYTIKSVLGRMSGDKSFVVATDEGIIVLDEKGAKVSAEAVGNGRIATNSILATGNTKDDWEVYYYDESSSSYHKLSHDGTDTPSNLDNTKVIRGGVALDDVNTDKYAFVYTKTENGTVKYGTFYGTKDEFLSSSDKWKDVDYTDVSYIGDGLYMGIKDKKCWIFTPYDSSFTSYENTNSFRTHAKGYYVTLTDAFYYNDTKIYTPSSTSVTGSRAKAFSSGDKVYFILNDLKEVYVAENKSVSAKTSTSLTNIEVIEVVGIVTDNGYDYINVITAESGAKCINLKDNSIDSSWK